MNYIRTAILALAMLLSFTANASDTNRSTSAVKNTGSAAQKIAAVDIERAVLESDEMKQYNKKMDKEYEPRIKSLRALQSSIEAMKNKLQKEGPTMTNSDRRNAELEIKRKIEDFELENRQLRADKAQSDQNELASLKPKIDKALDQVQAKMKYDMILDSRSIIRLGNPKDDITRQVIERLNQMN
ncbi:MAG: OmpH family outer membrane protein [Endozoicomonas sp. (ex Botrylloides leachii)]|nr:OmpH family outer membrane protein [Endozoicomonas sp. (ex Botrylloides leachii)]